MKRVLLFIIDALSGPLLAEEIDNGRYPHFKKIKKAGFLNEHCISIFPSITHAALTSLATGKYPDDHGIVGSHWYDADRDKLVYFSGSPEMVLEKGVGNFIREFLLGLNDKLLQAPTIFQQLEREGYKTASINFPIYRGDVAHKINVPIIMEWLPGLPTDTTLNGPSKLLLGNLLEDPDGLAVEASFTGVAHWFGFKDKNTADLLRQLTEKDEFPHFTLAYFPENDFHAHEDGPVAAHQQLSHLDDLLGDLFAAYGGVDAFLQQFALIITGDHSQSKTVAEDAGEAIDLEKLLDDYKLTEAGHPWGEEDDILPCPNLRAAHLYLRTTGVKQVNTVVAHLLAEERLDQIIYRAALTDAGEGYVVRSTQGRLRFWHAADDGVSDRHDNRWQWDGELGIVDGRVQDNVLHFPDYPNAFERIAGVLDADASGHIWMTAKIGHEIIVPSMKIYANGGSHAALHRLDSYSPLLAAGIPENVAIPEQPRSIDIAPLCQACVKAEAL